MRHCDSTLFSVVRLVIPSTFKLCITPWIDAPLRRRPYISLVSYRSWGNGCYLAGIRRRSRKAYAKSFLMQALSFEHNELILFASCFILRAVDVDGIGRYILAQILWSLRYCIAVLLEEAFYILKLTQTRDTYSYDTEYRITGQMTNYIEAYCNVQSLFEMMKILRLDRISSS